MRLGRYLIVISACVLLSCSSGEKVTNTSTYEMGARVPVGHLVYTIFERQWQNQFGEGAEARVPENKFYLLRISVTNGGGSEVIIPNTQLEDDAGTVYPEVVDGEGVPDWIGNHRQVGPTETVQGYLCFDVPPKHYKLRVSGEEERQVALIDIPLSFDSDVPDVTTPLDPDALPKKK